MTNLSLFSFKFFSAEGRLDIMEIVKGWVVYIKFNKKKLTISTKIIL